MTQLDQFESVFRAADKGDDKYRKIVDKYAKQLVRAADKGGSDG